MSRSKKLRFIALFVFMLFLLNLLFALQTGSAIGISYTSTTDNGTPPDGDTPPEPPSDDQPPEPPTGQGTIIIDVSPVDGGTTVPLVGTHTYNVGTEVLLTTTASSGFNFDYWSDGTTQYTDNPITVTVVEGTQTYTAVFQSTSTTPPTPPPTPPSGNFLLNPSVEDDANSNGLPDYWEDGQCYSDTGDNVRWCSGDHHTGSYCLDLFITKDATMDPYSATLWRQTFYLDNPTWGSGYSLFERGKTYRYRFWGKTSGVEARFVLLVWDDSGSCIGGVGTGVNAPTWTQSDWASYTIPQEAYAVRIGLVLMQTFIDADVAEGTTVWGRGDDFEVEEATSALSVVGVTSGGLSIGYSWFLALGAATVLFAKASRMKKKEQ